MPAFWKGGTKFFLTEPRTQPRDGNSALVTIGPTGRLATMTVGGRSFYNPSTHKSQNFRSPCLWSCEHEKVGENTVVSSCKYNSTSYRNQVTVFQNHRIIHDYLINCHTIFCDSLTSCIWVTKPLNVIKVIMIVSDLVTLGMLLAF